MTLSQSLIALTVVTVTMLVLWYIDKEIKILKMDINSTHNMLYNIKSEINNSSYIPIHDNANSYDVSEKVTCIGDQCYMNVKEEFNKTESNEEVLNNIEPNEEVLNNSELNDEVLNNSELNDEIRKENDLNVHESNKSDPETTDNVVVKKRVYNRKKKV